jgi:hypothetical protein
MEITKTVKKTVSVKEIEALLLHNLINGPIVGEVEFQYSYANHDLRSVEVIYTTEPTQTDIIK